MAKSKWKYLFFVAALATSVATFHTVQATITGTTTQTTSSVGNGVTVNYTIGFTFQRNSYLEVYLQDESTTPYTRTLLVYGSGAGKYTITGGDPGTTVVMGTAPSSSQRVVIKRVTPKTQTVDYQENAAFPATDHEKAMDRMVMGLQEFSTDLSKKIGLGAASSATVPTFPDPVANKILGYNSAGDDLTLFPSTSLSTGDVLRYNGSTWAPYDIDTAIGGGGLPTLGNADEVLKVKSDGSDVEYGKVANANIDSAAAIAHSKLANITSGSVLMGNGSNVPTATALSGDVTVDSSGVTAIGAGKVTNGMLAGSIARSKVASGTANQVIVNDVSGNLSGVSGGSNGDVLTFNGTAWTSAAPAGASAALTDSHILVGNASNVATDVAMSGDATIANTGAVTIANSAITDAKVHASAAITRSKIASGTASHVVINDGSGVLSSEATLAKSRGGTGADNSSVTFPSSGSIATVPSSGVVKSNGTVLSSANVNLASEVTGNLPVTNLNSGTSASSSTYWRGDGTWATPPGTGGSGNYISNPSAATDTSGWTASNVTIGRDTSSGNKIDNVASFSLTSATHTASMTLTTGVTLNDDTTGNCEAQVKYKGDGTKWAFQLIDGSANVLNSVALTNETAFRMASVNYPCGAGYKLKVVSTAASPADLNVGAFYWGAATNLTFGQNVGPWQSWTPTFNGLGTVTGIDFKWRQVGDSIQIKGAATSGTPTAATAYFTLPNSLSNNLATTFKVGTYGRVNANAEQHAIITQAADKTKLYFSIQTGSQADLFTANGSALLGSAEYFTVDITDMPIQSWTAEYAVRPDQQTLPTVQKFTSGSGTYTTPVGVSYIRVRMVGGGGGGSGSGTASWGAPGDGGNTTFGSSLLTANGGKGASYGFSVGQGGTGGTASLGTGPVGTALSGATGSGGPLVQTGTTQVAGAPGASSPFGGAGAAGSTGGGASGAGGAAVTNSGSGGGGAGSPNVSGVVVSGFGGGAGGYIDAIISSPSSTYSYAVGASGTAGTAGTSGYAGGAGGSGYIEVTEYYGAMNAPLLTGSVTSNSTGLERVERARISGASVSRQSGSWVSSVANGSTGNWTLTLTSGIFSVAPSCFFTADSSTTVFCALSADPSTTSVQYQCRDNSATLTNASHHVICMGAR